MSLRLVDGYGNYPQIYAAGISGGWAGYIELELPIGANFALFLKLSSLTCNNLPTPPNTGMTSANCNISNQMEQNSGAFAIPYCHDGNNPLKVMGSMNAWFCAVTSLNEHDKVQLDFECDPVSPLSTETFTSYKTYYFIRYA
jgi:hypothetical protein